MDNNQRKIKFSQFLMNLNGIDSRYADEFLMDNDVDFMQINKSIKSTGSISSFGLDSIMLESGDYLLSQ